MRKQFWFSSYLQSSEAAYSFYYTIQISRVLNKKKIGCKKTKFVFSAYFFFWLESTHQVTTGLSKTSNKAIWIRWIFGCFIDTVEYYFASQIEVESKSKHLHIHKHTSNNNTTTHTTCLEICLTTLCRTQPHTHR